MESSKNALERILTAVENLKYVAEHASLQEMTEEEVLKLEETKKFEENFDDSMDDDFNTANGITVIFELAKWINSGHYSEEVKETFAQLLSIFGIVFEEEVLDSDIEALIEKRQLARQNRDFATADKIRDELAEKGIKLLDTKDGVRWTRD